MDSNGTSTLLNAEHLAVLEAASVPVLAYLLDDLMIVSANDSALELYGYSRLEMLKRTLRDLHFEEDHDLMDSRLAMNSDKPVSYNEIRHRGADGRPLFVRLHGLPILFQGKQARVILVHDATEQRRTTEALQQSEARYRRLFGSTPSPTVLHVDGKIIDCNEAASVMIAMDNRADLLDRSILEFIHPDDQFRVVERSVRLKNEDVSLPSVEIRLIRTDGVEIRVESSSTRVIHEGRPVVLSSMTDITRRTQVEEALRASESKWRSLVDQAMDAIIVTDGPVGRFLEVNSRACQMLGYSRDELLQMDPSHLRTLSTQTERDLSEIDIGLLSRGESILRKIQIQRKDGTRFIAEIHVGPVDGGHYQAILRDLSEAIRVEQALTRSEARFQSLFEHSTDGILIVQFGGRILDANKQACLLLSSSREELCKHNVNDFQTDDREANWEKYDTNEPYHLQRTIRCADGRLMDADISLRQVEPGILQLILRDVTDVRRAHERLLRIESAVESVSDAILIADETGRSQYLNPAMKKLISHAAERNVEDISPFEPALEPGIRRQIFTSVARTGTWNGESRIKNVAGETRYTSIRVNRIQDDTGRGIGYVALLTDISERREAVEAIRNSEFRYHVLSELISTYGFSYFIDAGGERTVEWVTESMGPIFGYTTEEIMRISWFSMVDPEYLPAYEAYSRKLLLNEPGEVEFKARKKDGALRWFRAISFPVYDEQQRRVVRVFGAGQDITWQKQAEQELIEARDHAEEMNRVKSAFLANMSHEIRTPLTAIIGFADILVEEVQSQNREFAELIRKSGQRLLDTLNSVLDLAQLEGHAIRFNPEKVEFIEQCREVLDMFSVQARERGLALALDTGDLHRLPVLIDRTTVHRILCNLVSNAVKFTQQGSVTLRLRLEENNIYIEVEDTGIGISDEFLPQIFDDFKQESTGLARAFEGSGLGLAITRRMVELLGGTIAVHSRKSIGSVFSVKLPYTPTVLERAAPPVPQPAKKTRLRVLVVDDDVNTCKLVQHMLGREFNIQTAVSGAEAQERLRTEQFDVVLLDLNLGYPPNGEEILAEIKQRDRNMPVIAVTSYSLPGDRKRFLRAGFDDYVAKPFSSKHLVDALKVARSLTS